MDRQSLRRQSETATLSRAQLLSAAAAGLALVSLPAGTRAQGTTRPGTFEFPYYPQVRGSYTPEGVTDILNMLTTMEGFVVANLTTELSAPIPVGLNPLIVSTEQASLVSALAHWQFLQSIGGTSLVDAYTAPAPPALSLAVLQRKEFITTMFVAAYMTAARQFAELGQPTLVKYAFQTGGDHAEHRALARAMQAMSGVPGTNPAPNKAFETDLFLHVRDAYRVLDGLGLFGKGVVPLATPSRAAALAAAGSTADMIIQQVPNNASSSVVFTGPASITAERLDGKP